MSSSTIYVYTTKIYKAKGLYKIGETNRTAEERVAEQDTTSNPEVLEIIDFFPAEGISDTQVHKQLESMGYVRTRSNREWFCLSDPAVVRVAHNKLRTGVARPNSFAMRKEQQECHDKCLKAFQAEYDRFLFACVMRFGKTFAFYQVMKSLGCNNTLVITAKPEVCDSWREDLEQHVDFVDYNFVDLRNTPKEQIDFNVKNVFFVSFQYLEAESSVDKTWIYDIKNIDLVGVDEEHYGSKTSISSEILSHFNKVRQIHISGTPYKSWQAGLFGKENSYFYTYKDSQLGSNPGPKQIVYVMNVAEEVAKEQRLAGYTDEDAFHIEKLFAAKDGKFENERYVRDLMKLLFVTDGIVPKDKKRICPFLMKEVGNKNLEHIVVRVPTSVDSARALYTLLGEILSDTDVILAAGQGDGATIKVEDIKNKIAAASASGRRTITITCGRFETGVTVPQWGAIFLFNGGRSPESYNQMNFRASTPFESDSWKKENFYVFDFDPHRALELCYIVPLMDKKSGQSMELVLGEYFEVAPVLVQKDNKFAQIDPSEVINFYNTKISDMSNRFASEFGIRNRWDRRAIEALSSVSASTKNKIEKAVADNPDLEQGKIRDVITKSLTKKEKDEFKKIREKLQTVLRRLPIAILVTGATDVESLLGVNSSVFEKITGVPVREYEHFLSSGLLDKDWQSFCIEHASNKLLAVGRDGEALWEYINLYCKSEEASPGTPKSLAEEMLDKLPQEIWSDKTKTFCDPAFANGSFYFLIVDRLMQGLSEVIENPEERLKHIIENQVFFYESNEVPLMFLVNLVERQYNLKELDISPNICYNNFLEEENNMKFDVIVGNPPYNESTTSKHASSKKKGSANLSILFIERAMKDLNDAGYIAFVTPDHLFRPTSRVRDSLIENGHFVYADLTSYKIKKDHFPNVGSTFSVWIWSSQEGEDHIECEGKRLPNTTLSSPLYANTGKYRDWMLSLSITGQTYDWKRTKNDSKELRIGTSVLIPLASTTKIEVYNGTNMPINKDFYHYDFGNPEVANKVRDYMLSEEFQHLLKINKSGQAITGKVIRELPICYEKRAKERSND